MKRALDEIIIDGINTNIDLHKWFKSRIFNWLIQQNWLEKYKKF